MKVVIVDDEAAARRTLRGLCDARSGFDVVGEFSSAAAAAAELERLSPDLVFLDIQMDGTSGLQLARSLPKAATPLIVFVTAHDNHAVEAFELHAIDYLLKPFNEARFDASLARARHLLETQNDGLRSARMFEALAALEDKARALQAPPARLLGEAGGTLHLLEATAIERVESDRNYVTLHAGDQSYQARSTLLQAEAALQSEPMLKISRSCLINTRHLCEISRTPRGDFIVVLRSGATVTSSEGYREPVREYLKNLRVAS